MTARSRAVAAAFLSVAALLVPQLGGPPSVLADSPSVTLVTQATYDVLPAEHRVAVSVAITATSHLHDTVTRRYYVDRAYLAVIPTASKFHLAAASGSPGVSVSSRSATATVLLLRFGSQLGSGQSLKLTLTFDIVDPGGAPERPLRISPSLVSFQAWAFGSDGVAGSTVRVRLDAGYAVAVGRGPLGGPVAEPDGHLDFDSGSLASPSTFVADVQADRPGDLQDHFIAATVDGRTLLLLARSWPDDPAWAGRIPEVLKPGIPALAAAIGLRWPLGSQLEIRETLPPSAAGAGAGSGGTTGGSGGAGNAGAPGDPSGLDPVAARLDVAYTADPTAILHGAAHAWFNGGLVADRWIAEGFAALYAERAGKAIGAALQSPRITADAESYAQPLNAWVAGGPSDAYGYAAALALAESIAGRAGDAALQDVWREAAGGVGAYQPSAVVGSAGAGVDAAVAPETGAGPPDWRSLLDLLEERTGLSFEALWREWVVRPSDVALLDARAAARQLYDETVVAAGDWTLPRSIRDEMRAWRFDAATADLQAAAGIVKQRADVAAAAVAAGLTPPPTLRTVFEGSDGLAAASAEGVTELAVLRKFVEAEATRPRDLDIPTRIGLLGSNPEADIAAARAEFAAGDLDGTLRSAAAAKATWLAIPDVARGRILGALGLGLAIILFGWLLVRWRRQRQPRKLRGAHRVR